MRHHELVFLMLTSQVWGASVDSLGRILFDPNLSVSLSVRNTPKRIDLSYADGSLWSGYVGHDVVTVASCLACSAFRLGATTLEYHSP